MIEFLRKQNENDSFCLAPWVHAYADTAGERRLCCISGRLSKSSQTESLSLEDYWNSQAVKDIRLKMLRGERVSQCSQCDLSRYGVNVLKNHYNDRYSRFAKQVRQQTSLDGSYSGNPVSFDYRNATCNFKCRMCDSGNSTSWRQEEIQQGRASSTYQPPSDRFYDDMIKSAEKGILEEIYWAGGEPLILAKHWQVMNHLIETGQSQNIDVRYSTNLSQIHFRQQNFLDLVPHFRKVLLYLSQDAIGPVGEFLRTGMKWEPWLQNFETLVNGQPRNLEIVIDCTLTLPGLIHAEEFLDFFNSYGLEVSAKPVLTTPEKSFLNPLILPEPLFAEFVDSKLSTLSQFSNRKNSKFISTVSSYLKMESHQRTFGDRYEKLVKDSKRWAQNLDRIRNSAFNFEQAIEKDPAIANWWSSI